MNTDGSVAVRAGAPKFRDAALRLGLWATLAVCVAGFAAAVLAFLHASPSEPRVANAGTVDEYVVGSVRHFRPAGSDLLTTTHYVEGAAVPGWPLYQPYACGRRSAGFFVLRRTDGFVALLDQSTYWRRSPVEYAPAGPRGRGEPRLVDTCGDGAFSANDGQVLSGPAGRPLDVLPLRIVGGRLFVTVDPSAWRRRDRDVRAPAVPA